MDGAAKLHLHKQRSGGSSCNGSALRAKCHQFNEGERHPCSAKRPWLLVMMARYGFIGGHLIDNLRGLRCAFRCFDEWKDTTSKDWLVYGKYLFANYERYENFTYVSVTFLDVNLCPCLLRRLYTLNVLCRNNCQLFSCEILSLFVLRTL